MSLRPDSSEASASDEVSHTITSLASKYSAMDSATEGGRWLCRPIDGVLCKIVQGRRGEKDPDFHLINRLYKELDQNRQHKNMHKHIQVVLLV